jgi:manganese/zinc/iron transport system substrate-binding protein
MTSVRRFVSRLFATVLITILCVCWAGCTGAEKEQQTRPIVVATTTMIADLAGHLCGDRMHVEGLMRTGEDPHIYEPKPMDARLISKARLVLTNGLHLEGTLEDIIRNNLAEGAVLQHLAEDEKIKAIESQQYQGAPDPHCWFSIPYYKVYVERALQALIQVDPEGEQLYRANTGQYLSRLDSLDSYARERFSRIPPEKRVLVTGHDAFQYFGREYGIKVRGVIGISTEQEPRPQDIESLIAQIKENDIPAIFIETSVSSTLNNLVRKISEKTDAVIGGTLYSDSLGEPDGPAGTYIDMFGYNVETIVTALAG